MPFCLRHQTLQIVQMPAGTVLIIAIRASLSHIPNDAFCSIGYTCSALQVSYWAASLAKDQPFSMATVLMGTNMTSYGCTDSPS